MWAVSLQSTVQRRFPSAAMPPGMFSQASLEGTGPLKRLRIDRHIQFPKHVNLKSECYFFPLLPLNYYVGEGYCIIDAAHHVVVRYLIMTPHFLASRQNCQRDM